MIYREIPTCELPFAPEGAKGSLHIYSNCYTASLNPLPAVVICPGGAYAETSADEGEPVALSMLANGFQAFVLHYSTKPAKYPTQLFELFSALAYIHDHHRELGVDRSRIAVMGFSAGGHLAGCAGILHSCHDLKEHFRGCNVDLKPAAMVLSYPVVNSGAYANEESFENLLPAGDNALREKLSLESCVNSDTVPTFIWHTANDAVVPVQNSILLSLALSKYNIPYELHIYPDGRHGLSLANGLTQHHNYPVSTWLQDAVRFLKNQLYL